MVETRHSRRKNSSADEQALPLSPIARSTRSQNSATKHSPAPRNEAIVHDETEGEPKRSGPKRTSPRSKSNNALTQISPKSCNGKSRTRAKSLAAKSLPHNTEHETVGNKGSSLIEAADKRIEAIKKFFRVEELGDDCKPSKGHAATSMTGDPQGRELQDIQDSEPDDIKLSNTGDAIAASTNKPDQHPDESCENASSMNYVADKTEREPDVEDSGSGRATKMNDFTSRSSTESHKESLTRDTALAVSKPNTVPKKKVPKNELTNFIPGYTARLQLDSSSLNTQRPGLDALRKRALVTDKTTASFVKGTLANQKRAEGIVFACKKKASVAVAATAKVGNVVKSSFKLGTKREEPNHPGDGWFGMTPTPITEDVKRDLKVIRFRNYLDPKRFYKSADTTSKYVQVGTVIEGTAEFYSARLSKKERRSNLTEELMADPVAADYTKRKFRAMQQEKGEKSRKRQKMFKNKRGKRCHA